MAQLLTQIEAILKDKYMPALANQIGIEPSPFLEKIKKTPMTNNKVKCAAPIGINGGFGFGSEGIGTPTPGAQKYAAFELESVDMYVDIQISNKTIQLASNNVGSMLNALDAEVKGSYASAKWNVGRSLFGNGKGILTTISALAVAGNTVTVADTKNLIEGLTIDFYATNAAVGSTPAVSARRITAVDRVNKTITFDGTATTLAAGFITVQNSYGRELCGLGAIYDSSITSLYGLTKSDNKWLEPVTIDAEHDFNDITIYNGVKQAKRYKSSNTDLIMAGDSAFLAYQDYMKTNNVQIVQNQQFEGGAAGYKVLVGSNAVTIVNESFVPDTEAYGVDTTMFELQQTAWNFMTKDGGIFIPISGTSIYRALLASYGNLICSNPGGCVRYINCEPAA